MIRLEMRNHNIMLTAKQQEYKLYYQVKMINMIIFECLTLILKLHLWLNTDKLMKKDSQYQLLNKSFKD